MAEETTTEEQDESQEEPKGKKSDKKKPPPFVLKLDNILIAAKVVLRTTEKVYGSMSPDPAIVTRWLESKGEIEEEQLHEKIAAVGEVQEEERRTSIFRAVDAVLGPNDAIEQIDYDLKEQGVAEDQITRIPVLRDFMIKSMLRDASTATGLTRARNGVRPNLKVGFTILPRIIPMYRTGTGALLKQADGTEPFAGHVGTPQGQRSILKTVELVKNITITFKALWVKGYVSHAELEQLLIYSGIFLGIGSQRRFEAGKFEVVKIEQVDPTLKFE